MRRRKKKAEEHVNHERWLVSYADFITLLFAFFVVMYALSSVNEGKYRVLAQSLVHAFNSPSRSLAPIQVGDLSRTTVKTTRRIDLPESPLDIPLSAFTSSLRDHSDADMTKTVLSESAPVAAAEMHSIELMASRIEKALSGLIERKLVVVRRNPRWIEVRINTSVLFDSGSATLSPGAVQVLERVAEILRPFPNRIHVQGFTDNVPINTPAYPSNWELSGARAASVVRLMIDYGVNPNRLAATGYGEYHPIAENSTLEGRAQNRRVALVVLAASGEVEHAPPYDSPLPTPPPVMAP